MNVPPEVIQILDCYPLLSLPTAVEPLGAAGGLSGAQFWRIKSLADTFVLRRWPTEHPLPEQLRWIHAVLKHASTNGCRVVPVPLVDRDGATFSTHSGHQWEVAPWMPGAADFEQAPTPKKLAAALTALAKFHNSVIDFRAPQFSSHVNRTHAVAKRLARLRELEAGGIAALNSSISNDVWPELASIAREYVGLLPQAVPRVTALVNSFAHIDLPLQPCLRDIWHDHVLFTGDEVTGLVDFGSLEVDTPATDIARLLGSLVGDDAAGWEAGLAAYLSVRPLSPDELKAVAALDASGTLLAGCNWIRWIYVERRQFESHAQVRCRIAKLLERARTVVPH